MKQTSLGRRERRKAARRTDGVPLATPEYLKAYVDGERLAGRLYFPQDVKAYIDGEKKAGRLYDLGTTVALVNENTTTAIQIVFTAIMEAHVAGASRILRDIDPLVTSMFKDLERITLEDGLEVANAKMLERYHLAKRRSYRPIRGLEHLLTPKGGSAE